MTDRIKLYKEAMSLEEKRAQLQSDLDSLHARLSDIKTALFNDAGPVRTTAGSATVVRSTDGRSARGALKAEIIKALIAAGSNGARVRDIAATLGAKVSNIHSWFQTSGRKVTAIKKVGQARYRIEGGVAESEIAGAKSKGAKRGRKPGKAAKAPKAAKVKKDGAAKKNTRPHSKRGELSARIMEELKAAGAAGVKVRDLAEKLGVARVKNLFIWFSTTGKKNSAIKKIGEAQYALGSSDAPAPAPAPVVPAAEPAPEAVSEAPLA